MGQIHGSGAGNWGNAVVVDSSLGTQQGRLYTNTLTNPGSAIMGIVSTNNSTNVLLPANGSFVGTYEDVSNQSIIYVSVRTDVSGLNSTNYSLHLDFSQDATAKDIHEDYYIGSSEFGKIFSVQPSCKYFRPVYYNGTGSQGVFRLQTIYRPSYGKPSSHRIGESINDQNDAELQMSVLTAKGDDGIFNNITATSDNSLRVTDISQGLAISKGSVGSTTFVHKFGNAPDFDTGDNAVTVWDGANDGGLNQMNYNYSITPNIDSIVSSSSLDTQLTEFEGLDASGLLYTGSVTLAGSAHVSLGSSLIRLFRVKNLGSTNYSGNVSVYVSGPITDGVPIGSSVRAQVIGDNNQTLMSVYTIPTDKTGYMRSWFSSTAGANKTSNYIIDLKARPSGGVFQLKHRTSLADAGTSQEQHVYVEPTIFEPFTDIEMTAKITQTNITEASISAGFDIVLVDN